MAPVSDRWLEGAGGIGGLLAVHDRNGTYLPAQGGDDVDYVYTYDANGNVGQLIDWSHDPNDPAGAIVAKYQYDPYGNPLHSVTDVNASGPYAAANPYRFSTKPFDDEIGWGYWGRRYYDPKQGRWTNHDPIGALGGMSLYAYAAQDPVNYVDATGQFPEARWINQGSTVDTISGAGRGVGSLPPPQPTSAPTDSRPISQRCPLLDPLRYPICSQETCDQFWRILVVGRATDDQDVAGGKSTCENGRPCYCVFDDVVRQNAEKHDGIPKGSAESDGVLDCVGAHEQSHVRQMELSGECGPESGRSGSPPGGNDEAPECLAYSSQFSCLVGKTWSCGKDDQCYARYLAHLESVEKRCEKQCIPKKFQMYDCKEMRESAERAIKSIRAWQKASPITVKVGRGAAP